MASKKIIIVALGAPSLSQVDNLQVKNELLGAGYDIIVPDYKGFCRSGGIFTPENCIKTLIETKEICRGGIVYDVSKNKERLLEYENIFYMGISFGGSVVASISKFDSSCDKIGLFSPVLDFVALGKNKVDAFRKNLMIGSGNIYRGIELPIRENHFVNKSGVSPIETVRYLSDKNIFIAHGECDERINVSQIKDYFSMKQKSPSIKDKLNIYEGLGHGKELLKVGIKDYITRLE